MDYKERTLKFHQLYRSKIAPIFEQYETERKLELIKYVLGMFFAVLCFLAPIGLFMLGRYWGGQNANYLIIGMFISIIVGAVTVFVCKDIPKDFAMKLKQECLPYILKLFNDIEWRNNENIIADTRLERSGLFGEFNIRHTDDEFIGSFKDVPFKICETDLWYESGSSRRKTCMRVFKGVVISFKANKEVKNRTMIATKGDITKANQYLLAIPAVLCLIVELLAKGFNPFVTFGIAIGVFVIMYVIQTQIQNSDEPLNKVTLEDPRFCNKFNAYSSDQVEARYLLTTAFIERFQNLQTAFGTNKAKCSFLKSSFDDEVIIAISTKKNLFELGSIFKSLRNPESINGFYNELSSIYNMVGYFKLDQKIGL